MNNYGVHSVLVRRGKRSLGAGLHAFRLESFQSCEHMLLVLEASIGPEVPYETFDTRESLLVESGETPEAPWGTLDSGVISFPGMDTLCPEAGHTLEEILRRSRRHAGAGGRIEGHATGSIVLGKTEEEGII